MIGELHRRTVFAVPWMEHLFAEVRCKSIFPYRSNEILIDHISLDLLYSGLQSWDRLLGRSDDITRDRLWDIMEYGYLEHRIDGRITLPCLDTEEIGNIGDECEV